MSPAEPPPRELVLVKLVESVADVRQHVREARRRGLVVGCVPTMGALHAGHASLVEAARRECGYVVVTVFVNPTQFGPNEDFSRYPRMLEGDLALCRGAGANLMFHPDPAAMYPEGFQTTVEVAEVTCPLEGAHRPGHFRGVTTVVLKLLNIVQPDVAYFGLKDYQQQLVVRTMCRDLDLPVEIRPCETVREPDGLAMSNRNRYLSADERRRALSLSQALAGAREQLLAGETNVPAVREGMLARLRSAGADVDYATVADPETLEELNAPRPEMVALVAARVGATRLIDNMRISLPGS